MANENKINLTIIISVLIIGILISGAIITGFFIIDGKNDKTIPPLPVNFEGLKTVTKIIDGDTVIVEGESVRLLGIDADEKGYPCYDVAKNKIEELVLGKEVVLKKDVADKDQYGRYLRYIFLNNKNINLQLVEEGLAVARFSPENVKYKQEIVEAEKNARENEIGCKWGEEAQVVISSISQESDWEKLTKGKTDLEVIGACNAGNYYGREKIVEGKIVDAYKSKTNTVFLNFEKPYPNHCFVAVIFSSNLYKFPENIESYFEGKNVRVKGAIKEYQGKPEIILESMGQVEIGS